MSPKGGSKGKGGQSEPANSKPGTLVSESQKSRLRAMAGPSDPGPGLVGKVRVRVVVC